jgi:hypothetical protein
MGVVAAGASPPDTRELAIVSVVHCSPLAAVPAAWRHGRTAAWAIQDWLRASGLAPRVAPPSTSEVQPSILPLGNELFSGVALQRNPQAATTLPLTAQVEVCGASVGPAFEQGMRQ